MIQKPSSILVTWKQQYSGDTETQQYLGDTETQWYSGDTESQQAKQTPRSKQYSDLVVEQNKQNYQ